MAEAAPQKQETIMSAEEILSEKAHDNADLEKDATTSVSSIELNIDPQPLAQTSKAVAVFTNIYDVTLIMLPIMLIIKTGIGVGFWANQDVLAFEPNFDYTGGEAINDLNALVRSRF